MWRSRSRSGGALLRMMLQAALELEQGILLELKAAMLERWKAGKRDEFTSELRRQIRTQGFRIAAIKRMIKHG